MACLISPDSIAFASVPFGSVCFTMSNFLLSSQFETQSYSSAQLPADLPNFAGNYSHCSTVTATDMTSRSGTNSCGASHPPTVSKAVSSYSWQLACS